MNAAETAHSTVEGDAFVVDVLPTASFPLRRCLATLSPLTIPCRVRDSCSMARGESPDRWFRSACIVRDSYQASRPGQRVHSRHRPRPRYRRVDEVVLDTPDMSFECAVRLHPSVKLHR